MNYLESQSKVTQNIFLISRPISNSVLWKSLLQTRKNIYKLENLKTFNDIHLPLLSSWAWAVFKEYIYGKTEY